MKTLFALLCMFLAGAFPAFAEESYEMLTIGTNLLKNVRIIQASPVDLLIGHEDGYKRIKLQDLPENLKAKYPFDAGKAADYEKQKAKESHLRQGQTAAVIRGTLLAKESQLQTKIASLETEMKRSKLDVSNLEKRKKGKGQKSAERKQLDQLRASRMKMRDQMWSLQDELEQTKAQRMKFQ